MAIRTISMAAGEPRFYRSLGLYFLCNIAIIGFLLCYCLCVPMKILGRIWKRADRLADQMLCKGITLMMDVQPWLNLQSSLEFPTDENGKKVPCFTLSNHRSHLDMFLLLSKIEGLRVIAKRSLFNIPFLAFVMRLWKHIPVKQGDFTSYHKALDRALEDLREGVAIHIFPEMTRCPFEFQGIQKFHLPIFRMAKQAGLPIVPIVFVNTDRVWKKGYFGISFRQSCSVQMLAPIEPANFPTAAALRDNTHRVMETFLYSEQAKCI